MTANPWPPTELRRVVRVLTTSTTPIVVATDAGDAYVKTLGNPEGPTSLLVEWVGTGLAAWLGLPTVDVCILSYPDELAVDLKDGCRVIPGPAFVTRATAGEPWGGGADELEGLENPEALTAMVVLDTWTRNRDRYFDNPSGRPVANVRNVFLGEGARAGRSRLVALDQSACFRGSRSLSPRLLRIDEIREPNLYGLFPGFIRHVTPARVEKVLQRLAAYEASVLDAILAPIPASWGLTADLGVALRGFCAERAAFVCEHITEWLRGACGWHTLTPSVTPKGKP
jgi:hypothetical protein